MITSVCFLLFVATVPLVGGRLSRLAEVRLKAWWTIIASLVIQVFLIEVFAGSFGGVVSATIHLLSYGLAIMFVWHNRRITGMALMVFGGMLNLVAIAANGGVMPANLSALETAGIITDSDEFENSAPIDDPTLGFLGDIFAIPEGIPFANVFSIGDIILVIGGGVTVHSVCDSRLGRLWSRRRRTIDTADVPAPTDEVAMLRAELDEARPRLEALARLEAMAEGAGSTPEALALQAGLAELEHQREELLGDLHQMERTRHFYEQELLRLAAKITAG